MNENSAIAVIAAVWLAERLARLTASHKTAKRRDEVKAAKETGK